MSPLLDRTAA